MKILLLISAPTMGGAEVYVKDLAKALTLEGHTVHIGFLDHAADLGRDIGFEHFFLSELDTAGIGYFFIGHSARKFPWMGAVRVRNYSRCNGIEIYHSHLTYGVAFGALLRIPRVYTHHTITPRVNRFLFSVLGRLVDRMVGISELCAKALSAHSGREVTTIFNSVDLRKFPEGTRMPRHAGTVIECLAVGRICEDKNYELLIDAVAFLPETLRRRLSIRIVGEGLPAAMAELRERIAARSLSDTIHLLGNRSDVPQLLAQSQLFLMTSSREGLPIALIEATLSGLPCVVTDVGGCREVIDRCYNGKVVEPGNASALADAIAAFVNDPAWLTSCSVNALSHSSIFSIEHACSDHVMLYRNMMASTAAPVL